MAAFEQVGIQAVIKGLGDYKKGAKDIDAANTRMGKSSLDAADKTSKMQKVLAKVGPMAGVAFLAAGAAALKFGTDFENAFNKIRTQTGATGTELSGLKKSFENVFAAIPTSIAKASDAVATFNTLMGATGEVLQELSKTALEAARVLGEDSKALIEQASRAFNSFEISAEDAVEELDRLFVLAQKTGIPLTELLNTLRTYGPVLKNLGMGIGESAALFASLHKAGIDVSRVMPGINAFMRRLAAQGVSDLAGALKKTIQAIQDATTDVEALNLATEAFGAEGAQRMNVAIRTGTLELDDLIDAMGDAEGAIGDAAEATMTWQDRLTILRNKGLVALRPALMQVVTGLEKFIDLVAKIAVQLGRGIKFLADYKEGVLAFALVLSGPALLAGVSSMVALGASLARMAVLSFTNMITLIQLLASARTGTQILSVVGMFTRMAGPLALGGIAVAAGLAVAGIVLLVKHLSKGRDRAKEMAKANEELIETLREINRRADLGQITGEFAEAQSAVESYASFMSRVIDVMDEYARKQRIAAMAIGNTVRHQQLLTEATELWDDGMGAIMASMVEFLGIGDLTAAELVILESLIRNASAAGIEGANLQSLWNDAQAEAARRAGEAGENLEGLPEQYREIGEGARDASEPLSEVSRQLQDIAEYATASDEALKPMIETLRGLEGVLTPEVAALDAKIAALKEDIVLAELAEGADSERIPPLQALIAGLQLEKDAILTAIEAMTTKILAEETLQKAEEGEVLTLEKLFEKIAEVARVIGIDTEAEWGLAEATEAATETLGEEAEKTVEVIEVTDEFKQALEEAARQGDQTAEDMLAAMAEAEFAILAVEEQVEQTSSVVEGLGNKTLEQAPKFGELERVGRTAMDNIASSAYGTRDAILAVRDAADAAIAKLLGVMSLQAQVAQGEGQGSVPGFQAGGIVPGPIGKPILVRAHGGERIISVGQRNAFEMPISVSLQGPDWAGIRRAIDAQLDVALDTARSRSLRAGASITGGIG